MTNCIVQNNEAGVEGLHVLYSNVQGGENYIDGPGNINMDPMFVSGYLGDYYLSQISAGQEIDSPCIDAGSDASVNLGYNNKTTRTNGSFDTGIVDMGYHYPPELEFGGPVDPRSPHWPLPQPP